MADSSGRRRQASSLRIRPVPELPDVFLVVADGSEPGTVPVIPTQQAEAYWVLMGAPASSSRIDRLNSPSAGAIGPDHPSRWSRMPGGE